MGKPSCFALDSAGVGHFYGHAEKSAELTAGILRRLRFDRATEEAVTALVAGNTMSSGLRACPYLPNLLVEIATVISEMNISIKNVSASLDEKTQIATFRFAVEVKSREQMDKVVKQLMKKSDVIDVFRA